MRIHLVTVGQPVLEYARLGCDEYAKRLGRYHKLRVTRVRDSRRSGQAGRQEEALALLEAARGAYVVALDERGLLWSTEELASFLAKIALENGEIAFLIGGPDGLHEDVRTKARVLWSLSRLTLPHDLAQLVMLEAVYRASSLLRNEPYHR